MQHVVDQSEQVCLTATEARQRLALLARDGAVEAHLDELRVAANRVEGRSELV
jgi:hypothetical protein